jgi:hypothetical protein
MARQFRIDDSSVWGYQYGSGMDGAYTPVTGTDAPINSACTGTSGATTLTATNTSFAPGQVVIIHQTEGTNAGQWELNHIKSYMAGTITFDYALINSYTAGAQVQVLPQYAAVSINGGVTLTASAWNGTTGGILGWLCAGLTEIDGTLAGNGGSASGGTHTAGIGFIGGTPPGSTDAQQGEGSAGVGVNSTGSNGNGGGGARDASGAGGGGGGGGNGTAGSNGSTTGRGSGGTTAGAADLTTMVFGGGGGGGAVKGNPGDQSGAGGSGAGIVVIISKVLTITGSVTLNGGNGGNTVSVGGQTGGGGGGAGGSFLVKCQVATLGSGLVTATGGAKGTGFASPGGDGGVGRIHIDYLGTVSGTTTPSMDTRQDSSLATVTGFLFNML